MRSNVNHLPLGQLAATPGAIAALTAARLAPTALLARHAAGDWGDVCREDAAENERSVRHGFRILSAYTLPTGDRVGVITEADRSTTTLLLPDEY